jgi:hypothetical protein
MAEVLKAFPAEEYRTEQTIGALKDDEDIDADTSTSTQDAPSLLSQGAEIRQDYEALLMD